MSIHGFSGSSVDPSRVAADTSVQSQKTSEEAPSESALQPTDASSESEAQRGNMLAAIVLAQSVVAPDSVTREANELGGENITLGIDLDGNGVNEGEATAIFDAEGNLVGAMSSLDADQDGNSEFAEGFIFDAAGNLSAYTTMLDENDDGAVDYMRTDIDSDADGRFDAFTESLFDNNQPVAPGSSETPVDETETTDPVTTTPAEATSAAKASGTFDAEHAGYSNALYTYDVDDAGNPTNFRQLIANTNDPSALGSDLNDISVDANGKPNLLLLANGANAVKNGEELTFEDGQLKIGGSVYDGNKYFSHDAAKGSDGLEHFQYDVEEDGTTRVFMEDLKGLGDRDFNDLEITVNVPQTSGPVDPPVTPRDDGTDVYVIDSLGDHGQDVTSVVEATAGPGIDVQLSGLPGVNDFDLPETRGESATIVNENVGVLKSSLENAFVAQLGADALSDPGIQSVLVGLDDAMASFENGTETMSDYLMVEESLTLLQFIDPIAAQELQFQLTSATNFHLNNFSNSADVQQFLNGDLVLTPETRIGIGRQQEGYALVASTLQGFAQDYHQRDIAELGSLYGQISALTVGGVTADLQNGLALSGLVDANGQPEPVPGFGADEQPVRVANVSAGVSLADIVSGSSESRLLGLFPPPEGSVLSESIAALNPGGERLSIEAAIANSAWQQMNDPSTVAGQLYAENVAAQEAYVQSLLDKNIIIVAAAGNSGGRIADADPETTRNLLVSDSMISVGASNAQGTADDLTDDTLARFSSAGADFVAEGENLAHEGEILNGTSFSAPIVSGLIARIAERYPELSADQILAIILDPANKDALFEDIEGTEQDGLGIIREDALDRIFAETVQ